MIHVGEVTPFLDTQPSYQVISSSYIPMISLSLLVNSLLFIHFKRSETTVIGVIAAKWRWSWKSYSRHAWPWPNHLPAPPGEGDPAAEIPHSLCQKKRMKYVRKISSQKKITGQKFCRTYKLRHCRWLIVDATLEASGAPIHELDGALGLDGCHCCVHILWHHVSSAPVGVDKTLGLNMSWHLEEKTQWVFSANGGFDEQQIRN